MLHWHQRRVRVTRRSLCPPSRRGAEGITRDRQREAPAGWPATWQCRGCSGCDSSPRGVQRFPGHSAVFLSLCPPAPAQRACVLRPFSCQAPACARSRCAGKADAGPAGAQRSPATGGSALTTSYRRGGGGGGQERPGAQGLSVHADAGRSGRASWGEI